MTNPEVPALGVSRWRSVLPFGAICLVTGPIVRRFRGDLEFQNLLASPIGIVLVSLLAMLMLGSLYWWNRAHDRRPFVWAVLVVTGCNLVTLAMVVNAGMLGGTAFRPSAVSQLLVYGIGFVAFLAVPLGIYRWVAARSRALGIGVYAAIVAAVSIASVPVEHDFLKKGIYAFDRGYNTAWDVGWGVSQYALGLALYLLGATLRQRKTA